MTDKVKEEDAKDPFSGLADYVMAYLQACKDVAAAKARVDYLRQEIDMLLAFRKEKGLK